MTCGIFEIRADMASFIGKSIGLNIKHVYVQIFAYCNNDRQNAYLYVKLQSGVV